MALTIDKNTAALLILDMQNDIVSEASPLATVPSFALLYDNG